MKNKLSNKTILITGASRGLGKTIALALGEQGAELILHARKMEQLLELKSTFLTLGYKEPTLVTLDLLDAEPQDYEALGRNIKLNHTHIDGVIFNAALFHGLRNVTSMPISDLDASYRVNLRANVLLTNVLLPLIRLSKGRLLYTSSIVGHKAWPGWSDYCITKFALESYSQLVAIENKNELFVNCIDPGKLRTEMRVKAFPNEDPMSLPTPEELMPLYVDLMSISSLHGQVIDGRDYLK